MSAFNLGFPRMGVRRELKTALESHWSGQSDDAALLRSAADLRARHWALQSLAGIAMPPSNDFSLYDHVLDHACAFGVIPPGYGWRPGERVSLATRFALARGGRGTAGEAAAGIARGTPALEMTKWFDTNYHYLVPVFQPGQEFTATGFPAVEAFEEALALGQVTRPVLLGPVSFLLLGKMAGGGDALDLLPGLLPLYAETLRRLEAAGARHVQMDEPCLALDLPHAARAALCHAYTALAAVTPRLSIILASYFGDLRENLETALTLPVAGLHLDLVRAPQMLDVALRHAPPRMILSLGVVDGRNVWATDLSRAFLKLRGAAAARRFELLQVAPSCSLLHSPVDLAPETGLDPELRGWMAFARQKLEEVAILARGLTEGRGAIAAELLASDARQEARRASPRLHDPAVAARLAAGRPEDAVRVPFTRRRVAQQARLNLPAFPTTTIGSFPQTAEIRAARAAHKRGTLDAAGYDAFLAGQMEAAVRWQEEIGMDVLVHGEFERNDMVEHFADFLEGFAVTKNGWVQSYGSRCVKPPVIFGDVSRPAAMTVEWARRAQALTTRPMKGMLTGPVTMMQWAFVRDDIPRDAVRRQLAYAIRDEVMDLEAAGIPIVQIDEPAFREGLPLRRDEWDAYLTDAVTCFRISASGVREATQIHTHMCYSEFNDIMDRIAEMDADVISIETARSRMELLEAFVDFRYPNEIGPGVYDIHAPALPEAAEMERLLRVAAQRLPADQIWVNPDCGLKTRKWEEVRPALIRMVEAARSLRG
ncbi:5-methyltetrahydropteroyltriglutamate--homocysteine S-methyltransferase [Sediminicoccus sp. KRV36]|uniref:5-methyltetrahydropteroyltriglutamate-- homocysteine S-methyltransferase n=1 Tax=Sediminicoccus sp. KRV36 TaxID=3133721 RepID=UPI00200FE04F|nr:5-methyltetrahydropteroyltriglutamate--homocysteine S-methyltransferase [Sediminicoccus rosea]UPY37857.1 5-methyltetrahydropteroyltriglutamate--homocysteine S-methyltransferase [Sediminicoccus rosea]